MSRDWHGTSHGNPKTRIGRARNRTRHRWWSLLNWCHGYKFGPIQRCRSCDHTSPYHNPGCVRSAEEAT